MEVGDLARVCSTSDRVRAGQLVRAGGASGMWGRLGIVLSGTTPVGCEWAWWKVQFGNITREIAEYNLEVVSASR